MTEKLPVSTSAVQHTEANESTKHPNVIPSSTPTSIHSLPREIAQIIFHYLTRDRDCANFALSCRRHFYIWEVNTRWIVKAHFDIFEYQSERLTEFLGSRRPLEDGKKYGFASQTPFDFEPLTREAWKEIEGLDKRPVLVQAVFKNAGGKAK